MKNIVRFRILCCVLIIASCSAFAQDPSEITISLRTPAIPVKKLLAQIAKKGKLKFEAGSSLTSDIMIVRVENVKLSDLMKKISEVTAAEWSQSGDTWRLTQSDKSIAAQSRSEAAQFGSENLWEVHNALKNMDGNGEFNEKFLVGSLGASEPTIQIGPYMPKVVPTERAIMRILATFDPAMVGAIEPGRRIVFSTQPTRMQRSFPKSTDKIFDTFLEERMVWEEYLAKAASETTSERAVKALGPISKVLFTISRKHYWSPTFYVTLMMYGKDGISIAANNYYLSPDNYMLPDAAWRGKNSTDIEDVQLSKASRQFLSLFDQPRKLEVPVELRDALEDPVSFDPINLVVSDAILAIAEKEKLNLVAIVPDRMELNDYIAVGSWQRFNLKCIKLLLDHSKSLIVRQDEDWYTIKPKFPLMTRALQTNREALRNLIAEQKAHRFVSLDAYSNFVLNCNSPNVGQQCHLYFRLVCPSALRHSASGTPIEMYQLYGLLTPAQRQTLSDNKRLAFSKLSQTQRQLLEKLVLYSEQQLDRYPLTDKYLNELPARFEQGILMIAGLEPGDSIGLEPTEALPNGLPNSGYITIKEGTEPIFQLDSADPVAKSCNETGVTLDSLAYYIAAQKKGSKDTGIPKVGLVFLGKVSRLTVSFWFSSTKRMSMVLSDANIPEGNEPTRVDQLPADVQAQLKKKVTEFEKGVTRN